MESIKYVPLYKLKMLENKEYILNIDKWVKYKWIDTHKINLELKMKFSKVSGHKIYIKNSIFEY